jgi:hypothetical protein
MTTGKAPNKTLSKGPAKAQIDAWLDFYGLDFSDIEVDQGEAAAQTFVNTLVRAIMRGELEINVAGTVTVTQHLVIPVGNITDISYVGQKITLSRIAMEKGGGDDQTRTMQFMATMSGVEIKDLTALDGADLTVMRRVSTIFGMV